MTPQSPIKRKVVKAGTRVKLRTASRPETNGIVKHTETRKGVTFLKRVGYSDIHTLTEDDSAFF